MQSNHTTVDDAGRINVMSLLNPEPEHPYMQQSKVSLGDDQTQGVASIHAYSTDILQSTQQTNTILNETEGYEMAPWRQESGLGPPGPQSAHMAGTHCQQAPSHHAHYHSSSRGMPPAYARRTTFDQAPRTADTEFRKGLMHGSGASVTKDVHPHIFVPEQPIFGHSAMSRDKTKDYIRPCPSSDEPLGSSGGPHVLSPPGATRDKSKGKSRGRSRSSSGSNGGAMSVAALLGKRMRMGSADFSDDDDDEDDGDDDEGSNNNSNSAVRPSALYPVNTGAAVHSTADMLRRAGSSYTASALSLTGSQTNSGSETTSIPSSPTVCAEEPRRSKQRRTDSSSTAGKKATPTAEAASLQQQSPGAEDKPEVDWQSLGVPEDIWAEAQGLYDKVKVMKKVQNRQPRRMKPAILAALMFILCRSHGYPRTFAELCAAANVTKREIGMYYKLMNQVLDAQYTTTERAKPSAFLQRWCTALDLPLWIPDAACKIYERADEMGIVQGKSPVSISAASIWLVIWCFNHQPGLRHLDFSLPADTPVSSSAMPNVPALIAIGDPIRCDQRDVCKAASVVIATLTSVFKLLLPHLCTLVQGILPS
ncbi:hypothetical protein LPJ57_002431 [Coemansia sp. RSA 486]|nr:hypothetical protein LPJ57_002431 [Coemansia sp. RSA 486]KAJ2603436.1 hypothetical protein GGF39_000160 [Coemansia sp. RSA 1721]